MKTEVTRQTNLSLMKKLDLLIATILLASIWAVCAQSVPSLINYQGQLVDATGAPLANGNYDLTFRIYSADLGGSLLWGPQVASGVPLVGGRFNVILGPTDANSQAVSGVFSSNAVTYLEIQVGANSPISPRQQILSGAYSLQAQNSGLLSGYGWDAVFTDTGRPDTGHVPGTKIANASITSSQIGPGAITTSQLGSEAVTSANIAPGAVGTLQIASGAVGTGQIADGAVGTQEIANGAVGTAQIASNAVDTAQIATNAVGTAQIANGAVGTAEIAAGAVTSGQIGLPLFLSGYAGEYFIRVGSGPPAVLEVTNSAVSSAGFPRFFAGPGLRVGGEIAIEAFSHGGAYAYIGNGSDAADFYGNVSVNGTLSKSGGSFKIDDPLDPANKYLSHSFVESPDMKNVYDGVVTLDGSGEATVNLPEWFGALNKDFRYQLTAIGAPGPNLYIAKEIAGNSFKIAGGAAGGKVSWQVTGTRQDAWANAHRIPVEEMKPEAERGFYLAPELFGQSQEKSVRVARQGAAQREH